MTTLLLIDVQKDFHPGGSLAIGTADKDAERIASLIKTHTAKIDRIVATLDSHHKLHIAHPFFWQSTDDPKKHPSPFTIITTSDIGPDSKWIPRSDLNLGREHILDPAIFGEDHLKAVMKSNEDASSSSSSPSLDLTKYCQEYTKRLESAGRFQLCIWPEHCLIGTGGHSVVDVVKDALQEWSATTGNSVEYVWKGQHLLTEMYSALRADVPVSSETAMNESLVKSLIPSSSASDNGRLIVAGQAMSHCVNYTLRDLVEQAQKKGENESIKKMVLLTDCASAVPGFDSSAAQFQNDMKDVGVQLKTSVDVFS